MADEIGSGVLRIEVDDTGARASVDKFVADTDAKLKAAGISGGTSLGTGVSSGATQGSKSVQKLNTDLDNTKKKAEAAAGKNSKSEGMGALVTAIIALGPALVPIAGVAAASLGAIVLGAGSAALAIKGAASEMKAGTQVGAEYTSGIKSLTTDFNELTKTSAGALVGDFNQAVQQAGQLLPGLNKEVASFASITGKDAVLALHGLAGGFITLQPLFTELALQSEHLFADFDKYANGGGLAKFESWVQANLPAVENDLTQLALAVGKIVASLGPLGTTSLNTLGILARVLNELPIGVLQVAAPAIAAIFLAIKTNSGIDSAITSFGKFNTSIDNFITKVGPAKAAASGLEDAQLGAAAAADTAAASERGAGLALSDALGPIGAIAVGVGIFASALFGSNKAAQEAKQSIDDYTQSIEQDNGAIGSNTNTLLANNLVKSGAIDKVDKLGLSSTEFTQALLGNKSATADFTSELQNAITAGTTYQRLRNEDVPVYNASAKAAQSLLDTLHGTTGQLGQALTAAQQYQSELDILNNTTDNVVDRTTLLKAGLSQLQQTGNGAIDSLVDAMNTYASSTGTAADKAKLLGAVLVNSQGDALSYTGALADSYGATKNLTDAFAQQTQAIKDKTLAYSDSERAAIVTKDTTVQLAGATEQLTAGSIDFTKAGAGPLINQLQGMQTSAEAAAEAFYQHNVAVEGDSKALSGAQQIFEQMTNGTLVANAKQLGLTAGQAQQLADNYFHIPNNVGTQVQAIGLGDIDTVLLNILQALDKLNGTTYHFTLDYNANGTIRTTNSAGLTLTQVAGLLQKDGGVVDYYANGGMREKHVAQIAPAGSRRVWAEPETGGEAYIPFAPQKRARSTEIWRQTGQRLGQTNYANGGINITTPISNGGSADLVAAIHALASRPIIVQVDKREIARASNNGNLALGRGN